MRKHCQISVDSGGGARASSRGGARQQLLAAFDNARGRQLRQRQVTKMLAPPNATVGDYWRSKEADSGVISARALLRSANASQESRPIAELILPGDARREAAYGRSHFECFECSMATVSACIRALYIS